MFDFLKKKVKINTTRIVERVVYMGQDITAEKDGYVTLYGANHGHIDYLDELAIELGRR